jgi:predicted ribosome quality control (RQC) complex YloA/Tae2 family protein
MYFDALTLAAVVDELRATVLGGRVQQIVQPDEWTVAFELYAQRQRQYLVASAHPQFSRVHLTPIKPRRGVEVPTPLLLLMRKYVQGGRLVAIEQPAWERILHLGFDGDEGPTTLVCEVMGRLSNLILLDAGNVILDSLKRVTPEMTRVRLVLPRHPYVPPPPQARPAPVGLTGQALRAMLATAPADTPLWRVLLNGVRGLSPLAAREVVFRAMGDTGALAAASPPDRVLVALTGLVKPVASGGWQPGLVRRHDEVEAYAPYRLTQYPDCEPIESISAAVEAYLAPAMARDPYHGARRRIQKLIDQARDRLNRRHESLAGSAVTDAEVERLRVSGELILAYAWSLAPDQTVLEAAYDPDRPPLRIELDPALSPVENAQRYFREYEKAKGAAEEVPARLAETDLALRFLDQLETDLLLASSQPEIEAVRAELVEAGLVIVGRRDQQRTRRKPSPAAGPLRLESPDGFVIWVGRNARQNDQVTFGRGAADDLWLHARGVPGAHVIVKTEGRPVPDTTVEFAARLAAFYSRARGSTQVAVDVTELRHVRRIRGTGPGMVTYRHERVVYARLNE